MRGFICVNVCIGILLVSIEISAALERVHSEVLQKPIPEKFDTPEILAEPTIATSDHSHISQESVKTSLHVKLFDNDISDWIYPPDWALFTFNTPVYGIRNSSDEIKYIKYNDAMKLSWPYIHVEYYNAYQNDRSKRQIGAIELEHLVTPVSTKNRIHDITGRNNESESSSRTKRSNSDIVYPEILVIVDYDTFELHGKSVYNVIKYLHGFWNGVDLEFRPLESPKFRLNIAAILIDESNIGLSYISSNKKDSGRLAVDTAYHDSTVWLYDNLDSIIDRNKYDVAVTITSLSLCYNNGNSGLCKDPGPSRYGQLGNACKVDDSNRRIFKTIIVYDKGAYTGIYAATDELKHVFGVDHDSAPSTIKCNSMDGTASKSGKAAAQVRHWSKCSLTALEKFITTSGSCFYNQPELSYKLMPYLPGKIKNADQQCKALEGTKSYKTDAKLCRSLYCYFRNSNNTLVANHGQAPSGTRCGHKKMCLNTECVTEPEMNLIPQPPTVQLN